MQKKGRKAKGYSDLAENKNRKKAVKSIIQSSGSQGGGSWVIFSNYKLFVSAFEDDQMK